mmetsp:Transcript_45809/g.99536  ORF Transcript_45809/g.99536 Transcript_45809/m.99536 type:complete len:407 (-) Transcript_45809:115-1335(-)
MAQAQQFPASTSRSPTKAMSGYLLGYIPKTYVELPSPLVRDSKECKVNGNIGDLVIDPQHKPMMDVILYNDVKKCTCGKPCAYTLTACNACGTSLEEVSITKTDNVFIAFLLGVEKATPGFPLKVSLRVEHPEYIIIDDLLAMSAIHLNAIPAQHYIPDWRFLCNEPAKGLELLKMIQEKLETETLALMKTDGWMAQYLKAGVKPEEVLANVVAGFNFPPSQFQLHVQWIVCPFLPFHVFQLQSGNHMHEGRFFPLQYVMKALEKGGFREQVTRATPVEAIVEYYDGLLGSGNTYKDIWTAAKDNATKANQEFSNWKPDDFEYIVKDKQAYKKKAGTIEAESEEPVPGVDVAARTRDDSAKLQGYGRPYIEGKPGGTYYQHCREPEVGTEKGFTVWKGAGIEEATQ